MKVLLVNGSSHRNGCTYTALEEAAIALNKEDIDTEIFQLGNPEIRDCCGCQACRRLGKCVYDDVVNVFVEKACDFDGFIFGTPVYYAGSNGSILSLLDRLFYSSHFDKYMKVGAAVISSRRAGSTSALDEIYKYYGISNMPIVTSSYWNEVHGFSESDVEKDLEGLQTMRNLGRNIAFMIKSINFGKEKYGLPKNESGVFTSFHDGL